MNRSQRLIPCALCGRQFPLEFVLARRQVECACGMRIQPPRSSGGRHLAHATLILLAVGSLLTAALAMANRLRG